MKIALIGYGKMGKAIEEIAAELNHISPGRFDINQVFDLHNHGELTAENLQKSDVAIEFTTPHTVVANIRKCFDANIPVVVGSTGWTHQLKEIQDEANQSGKTFLFSPNYSIGVNIFFEINRQLATIMEHYNDYDVLLEEIHHTEKKDAPSGTGLFAALDIIKTLSRKDQWVNEHSAQPSTLSIISKREAGVPGTHIVKYHSPIDEIEIKHTAFNRKGFASGALLAAEWLKDKKGCFSMDDVLGFNK
ncbi:MAG: 4-hydroxy-tetrahydrodipicolinate reductase [Chitinophagales bacterium]|nr:4-hydroxy-tetrahydrodipicolinate reductase [Chitinophagales bacterium]